MKLAYTIFRYVVSIESSVYTSLFSELELKVTDGNFMSILLWDQYMEIIGVIIKYMWQSNNQ